MKLAGFNFNKISIERFKDRFENAKVSSNIEILEIKSIDVKLLETKEKLLEVSFLYGLSYEPNLAKVEFKGSMVISLEDKMAKEILDKWKEKETVKDFKLAVLNVIFKKCNVKALHLEEEVGLPLHLPMASLKPSN